MTISDNSKKILPLTNRGLSEIPPKRREGEGLPSAISQGSRMTIGPGIVMKGEISKCAVLVIEGEVEGTVQCQQLEILSRGVFKGTAQVETAEVEGLIEGDLNISGLLKIENGGSVSGNVLYKQIAVATGGKLSGEVKNSEVIKPSGEMITEKED
ncbi:MAG: polymer-forming cytoskeletal protein [Alphaproteobacteria bacterium]|nr:polymer-forming cytoskeletal protein [Alphaproteobacteria bacterium]